MEEYRRNGNCMERLLDRYVGQPIEVLTSDRVRYCGILLNSCCDGVEIIDECSRVIFIAMRHIDAIVEPKMKLTPFCNRTNCECRRGDCECEEHEHEHEHGYRG